jgi:aryl-alcohol dehydrogenase-like predicted oxidoreductase
MILGCGSFGGIGGARALIGRGLNLEMSLATLDEAAAVGITMLDTAERYAAGASETMIGRWLDERDRSITDPVRITTKVAPAAASGRDDPFDAAFIEPIFAGSVERLGVDKVDWLLIHGPDETTPIEATIEALESVKASGRCAHVGACNLDAEKLRTALAAADRLGITGFELVQNGYSLLGPDDHTEVRSICCERGLEFTAFSPLAGGVLTGKYRRGETPPPGTRLALRPEGFDELLTLAVHDAIDGLAAVAEAHGVSAGAVALAWLMHHEEVTALITGPGRTAPHLQVAAEALRVNLDAETVTELTESFRSAAQR